MTRPTFGPPPEAAVRCSTCGALVGDNVDDRQLHTQHHDWVTEVELAAHLLSAELQRQRGDIDLRGISAGPS